MKCSPFIRLCKSKRVLKNIGGFPRYHDFRDTPISTKIFGISFCVGDWRISAFRPPPGHFALFLFFPSFYLSTFLCIDTQVDVYYVIFDVDCRILPSPAESMQRGLRIDTGNRYKTPFSSRFLGCLLLSWNAVPMKKTREKWGFVQKFLCIYKAGPIQFKWIRGYKEFLLIIKR
jgi:hypothetical protein